MNKVKEYDALKIIAILLVIISHSTYYKISSGYGGIDYLRFDSYFYSIFDKIREIIYYFHMPLFMGISGALYCKTKSKRSYHSFINSKFKRLIIPFIVFTLFYTIPLKYVSDYFNNVSLSSAIRGQLFLVGNSHLWYLYALFIIFSIVEIVTKFNVKIEILVFIAYFVHLLSYAIKFQPLSIPLTFLVWFLFGSLFEENRTKINDTLEKHGLKCLVAIVTIFLLVVVIKYIFKVNSGLQNRFLLDMLAILGSSASYIVAYLFSKKNWFDKYLFDLILVNGLGIYIFSDTLNYVILKLVYDFLGIGFMFNFGGMFLLIIVRILLTLGISLLITLAFKKISPKYSWLVN